MSDLLSQDEIDALLHGVDDVEEEEEIEDVAVRDDGSSDYDFSSQDRIVRGRMPTLEMVNERFARHMRISLFNMMRSTGIRFKGLLLLPCSVLFSRYSTVSSSELNCFFINSISFSVNCSSINFEKSSLGGIFDDKDENDWFSSLISVL